MFYNLCAFVSKTRNYNDLTRLYFVYVSGDSFCLLILEFVQSTYETCNFRPTLNVFFFLTRVKVIVHITLQMIVTTTSTNFTGNKTVDKTQCTRNGEERKFVHFFVRVCAECNGFDVLVVNEISKESYIRRVYFQTIIFFKETKVRISNV